MGGNSSTADNAATVPLLPDGNRGPGQFAVTRRRQDSSWLIAYLLLVGVTVGWGIYAGIKGNTSFAQLISPDTLNDPSACPAPPAHDGGAGGSWAVAGLQYLTKGGSHDDDDDSGGSRAKTLLLVLKVVGVLAALVAGPLLVGCMFPFLVKAHPRSMIYGALLMQVGLPVVCGATLLFQGAAPAGISLLVVGVTLGAMVLYISGQLGLVESLLGLAGTALNQCWGLVGLALGLQAVGGVVLGIPTVVMFVAAVSNGHLVANPNRHDPPVHRGGDLMCVDDAGQQVPCCSWQVDAWVPGYMSLLAVTFTWSSLILLQLRVFTVAGTIAQWYYAPVTADHGTPYLSRAGAPHSRVMLSLRHALGPHFGSVTASAAVLTLTTFLRQALAKARQQQREGNILASIAFACLSFIYDLIDFLTKFAVVRMAITGETFLGAARSATDLLRRNALDTVTVWWLPPMILQMGAFFVSAAYGGAVYIVASLVPSTYTGTDAAAGRGPQVVLALLAFLVAWAVTAFFVALLLNVVDALFLCFAMDRDAHTVTKQEVHDVYAKLPSAKGAVVEQPGGEYAYGAPTAAAASRV